MGLNFSHCDARWSYIGFNEFREDIRRILGFPPVDDFLYTDELLAHPLCAFLLHNDSDGVLYHSQLFQTIEELIKIVDKLSSDYDRKECKELIEGMKIAFGKFENFEFK